MDTDEGGPLAYERFVDCAKEITKISDSIGDYWQYHEDKDLENGVYLTKKVSHILEKSSEIKLLTVFEYHVAYNINYGVPILCFIAWKQDGSLLQMEEYRECNKKLADSDILTTLTQLDHPVLCKPYLTLHPCRTSEIIATFLPSSKNPLLSWLSVVSPFLDLNLAEDYFKVC